MKRINWIGGMGVALMAAFVLAFGSTPGVAAEKKMGTPSGTFSVKYDNASLLFGFHTGDGKMVLNDGSEYAISLDGYSILALGFSTSTATGNIYNLRKPADINGAYSASGGSYAVVGGSGSATLKNKSNDVTLQIKSKQSGLRVGFGLGSVSFKLGKMLKAPPAPMVKKAPPPMVKKAPPPAAKNPVEYALQFGFNKSRVSLAIGKYLDTVVADWKGKPVKFRVVGHADMVGSKAYNQKLSQARADAVKQALVQRGIPASDIVATGVGQSAPAVSTPAGKRLRDNRRVVIMIEDAR